MLLLQPLRGVCPCCGFRFTYVNIYINLERDVYVLISMHPDGRCCANTSIEDCAEIETEEYFSSGYI